MIDLRSSLGSISAKVFQFWIKSSFQLRAGALLVTLGLLVIVFGLWQLTLSSQSVASSQDLTGISSSVNSSDSKLGSLIVDVGGAVVQPGVYQLSVGDRWAQAIQLAGGILPQADPVFISQKLNLAIPAKDGDKIYVPFSDEPTPEFDIFTGQATETSAEPTTKVTAQGISINQATQLELETLPGIGSSRAEDIINNRPYNSIDDLLLKEVVSQTIFAEIKSLISL